MYKPLEKQELTTKFIKNLTIIVHLTMMKNGNFAI